MKTTQSNKIRTKETKWICQWYTFFFGTLKIVHMVGISRNLSSPNVSGSSTSLHLNIHPARSPSFHKITENFWSCNDKFYKIFKSNFNALCPHIDVRWDLVHNIYGTVIYISYYEYVVSLKMAFIAETCYWWLLIDKVVFRLNLHLFIG
jgi:hypothetical protein